MKLSAKAFFTHSAVLIFFVAMALAYFHPVIQGKAIYQSDIAQYKGMAKERDDYKAATGIESYWTNSAFGGMPTFQLGANYPHDYIKKLDRWIRFLPRPADYLFLYFIGFYVLMCCMKVDWKLAVLGSLAFGLSTYYIIILGVGHNAKAHALGYLPMVLGGIVLVFRKKYLLGFLLTALAMALEISANHYQMTYYFMLLVLILGLVHLIHALQKKRLKHFFLSVGVLLGAVILGIATNATGILATKEYADWSTRGISELTINPDGSPKENTTGLDKDYITHYSYGILESLNLFVPRLFGGSNSEDLGKKSKAYDYLVGEGLPSARALEFTGNLPLYWGGQPGVAAPAYIGAVVFFLFLLSLFLLKGKEKWWLLGGMVLSLFLSWGKNFPALTNFMIDYFPLYNKFRAVSSIQVILELCIPIMAVLGLKRLFAKSVSKKEGAKAVKLALAISVSMVLGLFLVKGLFYFEGLNDATYKQYFGEELLAMIQRDREAVYVNDTFRTLIYFLLTGAVLFLSVKGVFKKNMALLLVGALLLLDLIGVNLRYVNEEDFVRRRLVEQPFRPSEGDKQLQSDSDVYRVFDPAEGLNGAKTSYFHKSLGGYHAAKPARMQDLFEFHLYKNNVEVLNMLNTKYIFQEDENGRSLPALNPDANGPAWFVRNLIAVPNANAEIRALDSLNTKESAVFNKSDKTLDLAAKRFERDSLASIKVLDHRPDHISYEVNTEQPGFLVFSEMHYPKGWTSHLNGQQVPHYKVNYALRGMPVPAGNHKIVFEFRPEIVQLGSTIALASNALLALLIVGGLGYAYRKQRKKKVG